MIIGKSLTALGGGGLKPEINVTAKAGALLNLHHKDSAIILQSYQLGAYETQHTFVVSASETAYTIEDVTNGGIVEVLVDAVMIFNVKLAYRVLNGNFASGYDNWSFEGTGSYPSYWYKSIISKNDKKYLRIGVDANQTYSAQQTVNFTGATELGFDAEIVAGNSICSFLVYIGSAVVFSAQYGISVGVKKIPISYSGDQVLKFTAKKTGTNGNAVRIDITDISVK